VRPVCAQSTSKQTSASVCFWPIRDDHEQPLCGGAIDVTLEPVARLIALVYLVCYRLVFVDSFFLVELGSMAVGTACLFMPRPSSPESSQYPHGYPRRRGSVHRTLRRRPVPPPVPLPKRSYNSRDSTPQSASHPWGPAPMISQTRRTGLRAAVCAEQHWAPVTHFPTPCHGSSAGHPRAREAASRRRPEPAWQVPMRQWSPLQWSCCPEL
jgi:hypothetical protein